MHAAIGASVHDCLQIQNWPGSPCQAGMSHTEAALPHADRNSLGYDHSYTIVMLCHA